LVVSITSSGSRHRADLFDARGNIREGVAREQDPPAGFTPEVLATFEREPELIDAVALHLLEHHLAPGYIPWRRRNISKSYVNRILRLALLAPDIVEAILDGRQPKGFRLIEVLGNGPSHWEEQRRELGIGGSYDRGGSPRLLPPPAEVRSPASMVGAVQDVSGDPRVVGEPLGREDRQATAPREQETLAGERVQDTGVAEACGVAQRHDHRTNVEMVAVCVRQGVDRYCPVWFGWVGEARLSRQGLEQRKCPELERVEPLRVGSHRWPTSR
jgi:hypothetical protein